MISVKVFTQLPRYALLFYGIEIIVTVVLFLWLFSLSEATAEVKIRGLEEGMTFSSLGVLAYFFGLRHALDADHLAAIDNVTRKLVQERKSPRFVGLFFSLGHSTVVVILSLLLVVSVREVERQIPQLESLGGIIGTVISGGFLNLIGGLNIIVFLEVMRLFKEVKSNNVREEEIDNSLAKRGLMGRFFGRLFRFVDSDYQMYPIGFLFGLGFDTASETALLGISAAAGGVFLRIPIWSLLVFPLLFTAGMTLLDTTDGLFMGYAYNWAFLGDPLKKVWYNLTMTGISVIVAFLVGSLELLGVVQSELNLGGAFWGEISLINSGVWWGNIGVIIVFTFVLSWLTSIIWFRKVVSPSIGKKGID